MSEPQESGFWAKCIPVVDGRLLALCPKPYPLHPRGCPNFGKRDTCPPNAPALWERFDFSGEFWLIWNRFNLGAHVAAMKAKHPNWSRRQLTCCLYWQRGARKSLLREILRFSRVHPGFDVTTCPEAGGLNVTNTMWQAGVVLEWPPVNWAYQVALAGIRLEQKGVNP